ncbi:MAG: FAD-dependent oxidoreductase [Alphaproteobacteria bacterium]|nr:FAD-dependent oxidoreductase [Alphaproteobacteria bacterium]
MSETAQFQAPSVEPYWWSDAKPSPRPPFTLPKAVDVAIVGAGYTGLSAALVLARSGRSVLVLDAEDPGWGASTRNGGQASGDVKSEFVELIENFGLTFAKDLFAEGNRAREHLSRLIDDEGIDCDLRWCGRFNAASSAKDYDALGRETEALNKHLGLDAEMVPREAQHQEIGSDHYFGGQVRPDVGGLHPALFHKGLLDSVENAGASIASNARVTAIETERDRFTVTTALGPLSARDVLVATNGYTGPVTPWLRRRIIPIQSQIIATEELPSETMDRLMPKRRMFLDTHRLHNYFRPSADGSRLLFGGRAGATQKDPRRSGAHLFRQVTTVFPELASTAISHSWSGLTGYTFDKFPHVGVQDGIHFATGFCGQGVVWGPYLGHVAALRLLGEQTADTATCLFDGRAFPSRPLYYGKPWFLPAVINWYGLLDRLRL